MQYEKQLQYVQILIRQSKSGTGSIKMSLSSLLIILGLSLANLANVESCGATFGNCPARTITVDPWNATAYLGDWYAQRQTPSSFQSKDQERISSMHKTHLLQAVTLYQEKLPSSLLTDVNALALANHRGQGAVDGCLGTMEILGVVLLLCIYRRNFVPEVREGAVRLQE